MSIITAHTGCMNTIDNSMESLYEAFKYRCEATEVDVQITADEVLVLNHDDAVTDENDRRLLLKDTVYETLSKTTQKSGLYGIVTVRQFLEEAKGKIAVNLDVKSTSCILPLTKLVKELRMEAQVMITGCELDRIIYNREQGVELRYMFNADAVLRKSKENFSNDSKRAFEDVLRAAVKYGCGGINLNYRSVSAEFTAMAHAIYMPVCVWTVNAEDDAKNMISANVDSITTRRPDIIRQLLKL